MSALDKLLEPMFRSMQPALEQYFQAARDTQVTMLEMDARLKRIEAMLNERPSPDNIQIIPVIYGENHGG